MVSLVSEVRDRFNIGTACYIVFVRFLYIGEFIYSAKDLANLRLFANTKLIHGNIRFNLTKDYVQLFFKQSKIDKNYEGVYILLAVINDAIYPIAAFVRLFAYNPKLLSTPLFSLSINVLTSATFQAEVFKSLYKSGIDSTGIKGYSFRKRAA